MLLYQDGWCEALELPRGRFTNGSDQCGLFIDGEPRPFDRAARDVFERTRASIEAARVDIEYAWFPYDRDGKSDSAIFEVGCFQPCESAAYLFKRGGETSDPVVDTGPGVTTIPLLGGEWQWHEE